MTSITQALSSTPAMTSYSSPSAASSRTLVHASVNANSMSVRQSSMTTRVCMELFSTRRTTGTLSASRGSCNVNLISTARPPCPRRYPYLPGCLTSIGEANRVVLDHGVGEQSSGNLVDDDGRILTVGDLYLE